jgi:hypothetical protein
VQGKGRLLEEKKRRGVKSFKSDASKSTRAITISGGRSGNLSMDPHELVLEKTMSNFDNQSDKLQKLLRVDKRYNNSMTASKLHLNEVDVKLVPGVALTQADGNKRCGGTISLN